MSSDDRDLSDELTDLECKMLKAIDIAWEEWMGSGAPLPRPLADLMARTHHALMTRAAKMCKDETLTWGPPEVALIRLEKIKQALQLQVQRKHQANGQNLM